jgi:glycosyltransferase involved in cell wall biosynthesis
LYVFAIFASLPHCGQIEQLAFAQIHFPAQMLGMIHGLADPGLISEPERQRGPCAKPSLALGLGKESHSTPWLVFSDDWGRHPTSCQHLIRHLLPEQPVTWVNMIGTRRLALDWATARRAFEKFGQWFRPSSAAELPDNLRVVSPKVWPGFRRPLERRLNRRWLVRQLRPVIEQMPEPPIAVTSLPTAADLIGELPVARWVYYCVDDFSLWPGIDQEAARSLEDRLIDHADVLVAASETLRERIASRGREAHLLTHGVDLDHWQGGSVGIPEPFAGLTPPYIVFWGLIDPRLDLAILRELSASLNEGTIVLIGPEDRPDPDLSRLPRVVRRPAVSLNELPAIAAAASVLVMPYADLPVTRAMQPLKLKEYLATGKPAVVRDLPATRPWADALDVCTMPGEFAAAVNRRLADGLPASQKLARRRLVAEDWSAKAAEFAQFVRG